MDLAKATRALLDGDALPAREWVQDLTRAGTPAASIPEPDLDEATARALAAALVELVATRQEAPAPEWTRTVPPSPQPVWLARFALRHPALRERCERHGPEPLRRRGFFAMPGFLSFA